MKTSRRIFFTGLDEVEANLSFIESAATLRPRLNQFVRWETIGEPNSELVKSFTKNENNASVICEGLLVRALACFEEFLRKLIHGTISELNKKKLPFDSLSENIRLSNRFSAGIALSTIRHGNDVVEFDFDRICQELGTCLPGATATLSADAVSYFRGGVSQERLEKAFASVGATLSWDDIGRSEEIKSSVDETGMKKASNEVQKRLEELRKTRNRFAHRGVSGDMYDEEGVRKTIKFLKAFSNELYRQLEAHLQSIN